ncbi:hypothetical protein FRC00_002908 [Tulasnella sp. 408]|nr:hypothetical protein FRC00_002908 [Tulasnella sp. 408]
MATLIAKLPSIRRTDGAANSNSGHQRLESAPPSPLQEETDIATLPNESASPVDHPSSKKKWKGKGIDPAERRGSASSSSLPAEEEDADDGVELTEAGAAPGGATESYPPMKDEELETRRVQENLRRWEEAERQRRKAARDSRAARTPSTLISDVAGYVTSFGASKPSSRRKDSRTDSVGTIPAIPDGAATRAGGWTAARTRDSEDVELEGPKRTPPDATPTNANFQKRHGTRPSQSSIVTTDTTSTVTSGPRNPFSTPSGAIPAKPSEERDEPFTPPDHHLISREASTSSTATSGSADDPFKNPEAAKTDLDLPLLSTPTNLSPATSPRVDKGMSLLQVPRSPKRSRSPSNAAAAAAKRTSVKQAPPSVRPLDLPEPTMPRMEPEPASGHWRRVQEAKQRDRAIQEEVEEDRARGGRWWTDWICGCREGNVREDQAGRTNPFE